MFVFMGSLDDSRLAAIERAALDRFNLADRVTLELIEEIRHLRALLAEHGHYDD